MQKNGESRFSLSFVRCLPIVAVLRRGIHNLTLGFCGTSNLHRCFASCVSLRYTMERMRISSYVHAKVLHFPRNSPWRECLSDSPSISFADSSRGRFATGYTRGASASLRRLHYYTHKQVPIFKLRTLQKAPLRKKEIVELCEAFHCERCFPELHSPQNLMLQKSKSVTCAYDAHICATDFGISSDMHCPKAPLRPRLRRG